MPELWIHCERSKERTGKEFKELHEWMDEGVKYLGKHHRFERHSGHILIMLERLGNKKELLNFFTI